MTYVKQSWANLPGTSTPISAPRLLHMETQYDEAVSYIEGRISEISSNSTSTADQDRVQVQYKVHEPSGSRYVITRIVTQGKKVPGLLGKSFGLGAPGGEGVDLKPVRETVSDAQKRIGASVILNASGWFTTGNVGEMAGTQIKDGVLLHQASTEVWWQSDSVGFTSSGELKTYSAFRGDSAQDLLDDGVVDSWGFGPTLVKSGVETDLSNPFWAGYRSNISGRQVIGQLANGDIVFITVNGKSGVSGISGVQTQQLCVSEGLYEAFNLDGGGSAQTVINGVPVVASSDNWGRRPVPDFIYLNVPVRTPVEPDIIPLVLEGGALPHAEVAIGAPPHIVDTGDGVRMGANITHSSGSFAADTTFTVSTLPEWARPKSQKATVAPGSGVNVRKVVVNNNGTVLVVGSPSANSTSNVALDSLSWPKIG